MTAFRIERWDEGHPRWSELIDLLRREDQLSWVLPDEQQLRPASHVLVALDSGSPVGFLAFLLQEIGPADQCPPLGLTEAKVFAFGVSSDHRRRRIGTALQRHGLELARELGCYQMRSVTDVWREENRRVKLALGFGVHPTTRRIGEEDRPAYVFVKRL